MLNEGFDHYHRHVVERRRAAARADGTGLRASAVAERTLGLDEDQRSDLQTVIVVVIRSAVPAQQGAGRGGGGSGPPRRQARVGSSDAGQAAAGTRRRQRSAEGSSASGSGRRRRRYYRHIEVDRRATSDAMHRKRTASKTDPVSARSRLLNPSRSPFFLFSTTDFVLPSEGEGKRVSRTCRYFSSVEHLSLNTRWLATSATEQQGE